MLEVRARRGPCGSSPRRARRGGLELGVEAEVDEGVEVRAGDEVDRAAVAAVAAVRAAARDELLAAEAHAAAAAVARRDVDVDFVDEHGGGSQKRSASLCAPDATAKWPDSSGDYSSGRTLMMRPCAPWSSNRTRPSTFANSVSSLPRPTFRPGRNAPPALPDEDRAAGDDVAVEPLHAQPLRVAVAAVAGTALSFFVCHDCSRRLGSGSDSGHIVRCTADRQTR